MLIRLGRDGVLTGVKDSSNDDVAFRFLVDTNADAGHPLTLLTGQEIVVDGAYMAGADGSVPGLGNVECTGYVRMWNAYQSGDWETVRAEQAKLARLMAMALLGVFDTNQMPNPVLPLQGENVAAIARVLVDCGMELKRTPAEVSASTR